MVEIRTLIDGKQLSYEGLFNIKELYKMIDSWFQEHGYEKNEVKNYENISESEKQVLIEVMPWKKMSDYAKSEVRIYAVFYEMTEVEVEKSGHKTRMNRGRIDFSFDAYLTTDYENKWENQPLFYFMRTIIDKWVYKVYTEKFESEVVKDCIEVEDQIKSFLNLNKF
jgi:hypothetical protein